MDATVEYANLRAPIAVEEIEISQRWQLEPASATTLALARLHGEPLGLVILHPGDDPVDRVWDMFSARIEAHAAREDVVLRSLSDLWDAVNPPTCVVTRQRALEQLPPVSVIIPTIGSNPRLANCVSSVLASDHPRERLEIVVVENRPRDSTTKAQLAQLADDRVTYHSTARVGAAHARNVGTAAATGDIVVFFDSDVVVDSQCVSALAQELIVDADVATGNVLPLALDTQAQLLLERFGGYGKGFDLRRFRFAETQGVDRFRAGRLGTGANMAFRRDVLMELGPMCEFLGPGTPSKSGDDSELLLRALIQGFRVTYTPAALVWHPSHADENALKSQLFGYGAGLSAHLVHLVLEYPKLLVDFVSILPAILRFFGSGTSTKNSSRGADFPIALRMAELRGVAWGLPAYAKSRASRGLSDGSE